MVAGFRLDLLFLVGFVRSYSSKITMARGYDGFDVRGREGPESG